MCQLSDCRWCGEPTPVVDSIELCAQCLVDAHELSDQYEADEYRAFTGSGVIGYHDQHVGVVSVIGAPLRAYLVARSVDLCLN